MHNRTGPGWNPSRRNRKIGTKDQGFKLLKPFDIPSLWRGGRIFWQTLKDPLALPCAVGDHAFTIVVEPTFEGFRHHVSVADLLEVIRHIPEDDRRDITVFALRQPTRKENVFSPVWGRMGYLADFGRYSGPSVALEAQPVNLTYKIENSVSAEVMRELTMLEREGHDVRRTRRHYTIQSPPEAIRTTQLFRTLLHEIGHYVDFLEKVVRPSQAPNAPDDLHHLYFARPAMEREHFAERYANSIRDTLAAKGVIPFEPLPTSPEQHPQINPQWFAFP
jgi:hypothetical protein